MSVYDWIIFFLIAILAIITGVSIFWVWEWKRRHDEAVELYSDEIDRKNRVLEDLDNQLKLYKDNERIIKIEQIHLEPRELECMFSVMPHFVEDTETFKKIVISETARYLAEELERDPFLCKIYHSLNTFDCSEKIKVRFRMLPYAEGVVWEDVFKKEEE